MKRFVYESQDAPTGRRPPGTELLAGGTDLVPLLKSDLIDVDRVLDVKGWSKARGVERVDGGWRIGSLTTLADIEDDGLGPDVTALVQAVTSAATRQLRNRATIGGNLLQRPRCSYFRNVDVSCHMNGGEGCPARDGRHEHHAIFDTGRPCIAVQPSDPATALVALGAEVSLLGPDGGSREIPVADLLSPVTDAHRSLNGLDSSEVISAITIPIRSGRISCYRKAMDRKAWAFALVGVAVSMSLGDADRRIEDIGIVAGGVANRPLRLTAAENALRGQPFESASIEAACAAAAEGAAPLPHNRYKVPLLQGLLQRSLEDLADGDPRRLP